MADRQINTEELSAYASESLAHYMVPEVFVQLEKMPVTQNGKIDKKAQPKNLKEPQTPMQKKIFEIVADVWRMIFFGTDTSFLQGGAVFYQCHEALYSDLRGIRSDCENQ